MAINGNIDVRPALKRRWMRISLAGLLFLVFCWAGLWTGIRWGKDRPTINPDPLTLNLLQNATQEIPGLHGVKVALDDITHGQVVIGVYDAADQPLVSSRSLRTGEVLPFDVQGRTFYLRVERLVNKLMGGDYGVFEVSSEPPPNAAKAVTFVPNALPPAPKAVPGTGS